MDDAYLYAAGSLGGDDCHWGALIFGDYAYVIALVITAIIETVVVTLVTEIDRESGKNKLLTIYYRSVKRYQLIYDDKGKRHYLSKKKRGVIYHVC